MKVIRINDQAEKILVNEVTKQQRTVTHIASDAIIKTYGKAKGTKDKKPVHPAFNELKEIYMEYYQKYNRREFYWRGAIDATALNRLIKTLEALPRKGESITDLFRVIMDKLPRFYKDKSINAINNNINGIITEIKTGTVGNISSKYDWRT
jgi:hypothetical protein